MKRKMLLIIVGMMLVLLAGLSLWGGSECGMSAGVEQWPELLLTPGDHVVTYSGSGRVIIKYREAVLE